MSRSLKLVDLSPFCDRKYTQRRTDLAVTDPPKDITRLNVYHAVHRARARLHIDPRDHEPTRGWLTCLLNADPNHQYQPTTFFLCPTSATSAHTSFPIRLRALTFICTVFLLLLAYSGGYHLFLKPCTTL